MLTTQLTVNAFDTRRIHIAAGATGERFLNVSVLPSQFVNGVNDTKAPVPIAGPEPNGLWKLEAGKSTRIRIPVTGTNYDFLNQGFAAIRADSVDAGGNPSADTFFAYVNEGGPRHIAPASGDPYVGTRFQIPLVPFNGPNTQQIHIAITPIANANINVDDLGNGAAIQSTVSVDGSHTMLVSHATNAETLIDVNFQGGLGVVSAVIQRRNTFRVYPAKLR